MVLIVSAVAMGAAYMAGRTGGVMAPAASAAGVVPKPGVPKPSPHPTAPLRWTPIQAMGRQLMECREKLAQATCAKSAPEVCAAARATITGDGIFRAIGGGTHGTIRPRPGEDWLDVIAWVDGELVSCAADMQMFYQRKVW